MAHHCKYSAIQVAKYTPFALKIGIFSDFGIQIFKKSRRERITFAILITAGISIFTRGQNAETPERLISLGDRFLLEQSYEQALVQFMRVIEIEPMNPRGYTGLLYTKKDKLDLLDAA